MRSPNGGTITRTAKTVRTLQAHCTALDNRLGLADKVVSQEAWIPALKVNPTPDERRDGRFPGSLIIESSRLPGCYELQQTQWLVWPTSTNLQLRVQLRILTGFPLSPV